MSKSDVFPRALPHRPAEINGRTVVPVATGSTFRRVAIMTGVSVLFLGVGLGLGLLFTSNPNARGEQPVVEKEKEKEKPAPGKKNDDSLTGLKGFPQAPTPEADVKGAPRLEAPSVPAVPTSSPLQGGRMTSQPGTPTNIPDAVVEALGGLTASHLYQTYLNIGMLADAVEGEVYEKDEARKLLDTVAGLMAAVEQQLDRVGNQSLKGDEKKAVEQARQVTAALRSQVRELRDYWDKGEKENVNRFHQARTDSWNGIKSLLNIQE